MGYAVAGDLAAGREEEPDVGVERAGTGERACQDGPRDEEGAEEKDDRARSRALLGCFQDGSNG